MCGLNGMHAHEYYYPWHMCIAQNNAYAWTVGIKVAMEHLV